MDLNPAGALPVPPSRPKPIRRDITTTLTASDTAAPIAGESSAVRTRVFMTICVPSASPLMTIKRSMNVRTMGFPRDVLPQNEPGPRRPLRRQHGCQDMNASPGPKWKGVNGIYTSIIPGSSSIPLSVRRNSAAVAPSTARWSALRVRRHHRAGDDLVVLARRGVSRRRRRRGWRPRAG